MRGLVNSLVRDRISHLHCFSAMGEGADCLASNFMIEIYSVVHGAKLFICKYGYSICFNLHITVFRLFLESLLIQLSRRCIHSSQQ